MIPLLIFSKDRACQLDALLQSIQRHAQAILHPVCVLWVGSETSYDLGYSQCRRDHTEVHFFHETVFRTQVLDWLEDGGDPLVCFMTDDDLLYRDVGEAPEQAMLNLEILTFSLRMGTTTHDYCYPLDQAQPLPTTVPLDVYETWRWQDHSFDWGYPMSLDGSVFGATDLLSILNNSVGNWTNPNTLEDVLAHNANLFGRALVAAYRESCLVGLPANRVQDGHPNRVGSGPSADALNRRYLNGERIDLDALDFSSVRAAHAEIELVLR